VHGLEADDGAGGDAVSEYGGGKLTPLTTNCALPRVNPVSWFHDPLAGARAGHPNHT